MSTREKVSRLPKILLSNLSKQIFNHLLDKQDKLLLLKGGTTMHTIPKTTAPLTVSEFKEHKVGLHWNSGAIELPTFVKSLRLNC